MSEYSDGLTTQQRAAAFNAEVEEEKMTAQEIDLVLAKKRWVAYPLLVAALKDAIWASAHIERKPEHHAAIDRAVQLLILLGEREQIAPDLPFRISL